MTLLATLLAFLAVLLALPVARARRLAREPQSAQRLREPSPARVQALLLALALLGGPVLALAVAGPRVAIFAASAAIVVATAARLIRLSARRTAAGQARQAVAEACALLSANLRVGMVPARALASAADDCAVLREAQRTLALGGDVSTVWRRQAEVDGMGGLRELARAWQVGTRSGASLTGTLEQVADGLSADLALGAVVGSELAGPRATGKVMAVLPLLGVGMGYLLGGDPMRWLAEGVPGWTCLITGVAFACAGVLWIESLARRAAVQG
jgi:tight adherence protein B